MLRWPWQRQQPPAPGPAPALRVLMVCTANLCRSPIAQGLLRAQLHQAGLGAAVLVDSAGTHGSPAGEAPDPRAVRRAASRGLDIAGLRSRPVTEEDFTRFDWLLAMDESNLTWLNRRAPPHSTARVELLMPYSLRHAEQREVPDPYYGAEAGFDRVLDLLDGACAGVVRRVQTQLGNAGS